MDSVIKIGLFILAELLLNRVVNLVFRIMSRKHNSVHLRFIKSILNVLIVIVVLYSLAQQFEVTKDISKTLLQSSSLFVAIATFAAQQALSNVPGCPEERGKRMFLVGGPWGPLYPLGCFPADIYEEEEDPNP